MPSFYKGHDPANDELLNGGGGQSLAQRKGYLGDSQGEGGADTISSGDINTPASEAWDPSGGGEQVVNGWKQGGTSAYDRSVDQYRQQGADAQKREANQLDLGQANGSRFLQLDALSQMRRQAEGSAPSSAAILSQRANQGAAQQVGAAGLRKGGPGAAIAAQGMANHAAGAGALAANAQNADARAGEISRAQGAYAGGANPVQGQDIGTATTNAQLIAQQRALNEAKQQRYERMGFDTRTTQLQAGVDTEHQRAANQLSINQAQDARRAGDDARTENNINSGIGLLQGAIHSDPRSKQDIRPLTMGSLSRLRR